MQKTLAGILAAAFFLLASLAACGAREPAPPAEGAAATRGSDPGSVPASVPASADPAASNPAERDPLAVPPNAAEVPATVLPSRDLHCDLQAKPAYHKDERVEITFKLTNQGETPLWVLRWNTPLEGLVGDCFEISHDGEVVFFQGRMVKRAMPEAAEYVLIPPGESREGKVDLRAAYKVEAAGKYQLRFDSVLFDVVDDETRVPRRLEEHQPFDPRCPEVVFEVR